MIQKIAGGFIMSKIAFITDSASGFQQGEHQDVYVVPMGVIINDQQYVDQVDISTEDFTTLLKDYGDGAKTFQPSPQSFHDTYQSIVDGGYTHIIAIHATKELTGTFQSSTITSRAFDIESTVIDSQIGSYPLRRLVEYGVELAEQGKSYEQIVEQVEQLSQSPTLFLYPKNLNQLKNSGRVSKAQGLLAGLLNIQLILAFDGGKIYPIEKSRSKKKVIAALQQKIAEKIRMDQPSKVGVIYTGEHEEADKVIDWLKEEFPNVTVEKEALVPVAGVHTGYGTLGIGWINK